MQSRKKLHLPFGQRAFQSARFYFSQLKQCWVFYLAEKKVGVKTAGWFAEKIFSGERKVLLLVVLAALPAALPFLTGNYVFNGEFHSVSLRSFELNTCLKDGILFPRWSPDLFAGKGAPLFNFYAPFAYYLVQLPVLLGQGLASSVHLIYALSILVSALGAFFFARKFASTKGAFLASVFYAYFPYHLTDVFVRGVFSESVAYAIMPFAAFFLLEALDGRRLAAAAVALALLVLAHSPLSLLFAVVFIPYVCAKAVLEGKKKVFVVSVLLGLGLSAVFWVPALAERDYVSLERTDLGFTSFMQLQDFTSIPPVPSQLTHDAWNGVVATAKFIEINGFSVSQDRKSVQTGLFYMLAVLAGLIFALFFSRRTLLLEALLVLALLFFVTSFSLPFWPEFLKNVQFSWRLLPLIALFSSALIASLMEKRGWKPVILSCIALAVFSIALILPFEYFHLPNSYYDSTVTADSIRLLNNDFSYKNEYAPAGANWSEILTGPFVENGFASASQSCYETSVSISATAKSWVVLNLFYYPNWVLEVDGTQRPLQENELGMVMFQVDAGKHDARVHFEETPVEKASWAISIAALLLVLALAFWTEKAKEFFERASGKRNALG